MADVFTSRCAQESGGYHARALTCAANFAAASKPQRGSWLPNFCRLLVLGAVMLQAAAVAQAQEFAVNSRSIEDLKAVFGTVESARQTVARSQIGGTITELCVDEGSEVKTGEAIARVDDPKLPLQLAALDSRINSARSQSDLAAIETRRISKLRQSGTASQDALDIAQTNLAVTRANLAAFQAERAVVAQQQTEGAVLAPANGRVLQVNVVDGQVVLAGDIIASIATETFVLRLRLPERHARFITVGDAVRVGALGMAVDDKDLRRGIVRKVFPEIDGGRVVADVEVAGLGDFFVGERASVYVTTGKRDTIIIPPTYLFRRYGITYARLASGAEVVVQTGLPAADGVEILAGLQTGDVLAKPQ